MIMSNSYKYDFGIVYERDIDVLLLNCFAIDSGFIHLFTDKISERSFENPKTENIALSKTDPYWGESDVTVVFEDKGRKFAVLIEDKVGAIAQPEQCRRYFERGKAGIKNGEYEEFFVFICASGEYIKTNEEAQKYPYSISFEELEAYFENGKNPLSTVMYEQIKQALLFSKTPYKKIADKTATAFWLEYVNFQRENYPALQLTDKSKEKSRDGGWPVYGTMLNMNSKVYIHHKMDRGIVDLNFSGMADRQAELSDFLKSSIGDFEEMGFGIMPAGKSAVLRKDLGAENCLSFQKSFASQKEIVIRHFEIIYQFHKIAASLKRDDVLKILEKQ